MTSSIAGPCPTTSAPTAVLLTTSSPVRAKTARAFETCCAHGTIGLSPWHFCSVRSLCPSSFPGACRPQAALDCKASGIADLSDPNCKGGSQHLGQSVGRSALAVSRHFGWQRGKVAPMQGAGGFSCFGCFDRIQCSRVCLDQAE